MYTINELKERLLSDLKEIAEQLHVGNFKRLSKQDLIYKILDQQALVPVGEEPAPAPRRTAAPPMPELPFSDVAPPAAASSARRNSQPEAPATEVAPRPARTPRAQPAPESAATVEAAVFEPEPATEVVEVMAAANDADPAATPTTTLPRTGPASWTHNQALMELGALVCTARVKRCGECPVRARCPSREVKRE